MALQITDANYAELVGGSDKLAVIDFWAEWCGPCKMLGPIVEDLAKDNEGKAIVGKLDVDNNPELSMKFGITSIPAVLFIKNGEVVARHVGLTTKANLQGKIDANL